MTLVQQILEIKGHQVFAVGPDEMVIDALKLMKTKDVGAVLVMDGESLVGIFTERHYTRKVFLEGRSSPTTSIRDVMKTDVIFVEPDQTAEVCMALMTEKRIRHLPVLSDGIVVGIVSLGDLMRSVIEERQFNIDQLVQYVRG